MVNFSQILKFTYVKKNFWQFFSLKAGGVSGIAVDIFLFPIDTIKTRLQSERGFWRSGGFKGIYRGLAPAAAGSAPTAALFFLTYETIKTQLGHKESPLVYMTAASIADVVACLIRVPVESECFFL